MLSQTDAVKQAWAAADRTLDIIVTVDGKDYQATEINSLNYDAGAFTGDTLGIGSTYENSVTIEFSSVVEAFKQGLTVLPKVGILVNGKFEYTKLGTFIMSEVNRDRNNNLTTIKALDQMCKLEGQYKPTVSAMASPLDIIADIANQGGVTVNTGELQHLPTLSNIKKIEGQTLRTAIGWIAQLYDGFAAFDRDGKLTIRTTATPDYTITPGEYQQGGLTKNEVAYKTGGIKVTVNTKKTDDSGQEVDDTTTLQAGETTGSQIELTNDSMTNDLLTTVWTGIKDITYYPYTLNWFGNPNLEAGDWVTLTDTQGNQFNVPVNQYTMSFNGGLESTISATQSSSTAGGYAYTGSAGSIKNMIEALQVRHTASGNNVYPPSYQGQPQNPKKGDVWYKQNGNNVEVWIYQEDDGKLSWVRTPLDGEVKAELQAMGKKTDEDLTRVKSELSSEAESQWQSAKTATSETDQRLTSLQAENNKSLADLHNTADSLHAAANSLVAVDSSMRAATSEVANSLNSVKNSLAAVDADLRNGVKQAGNDLSAAKTSLAATGNSLATATSELQRQTGQLSGSLSTADSMIMFNSNAIAEVKRTAGEISTTVSNIKVGDRNLARGVAGGKDWCIFNSFNGATNWCMNLVAYSLSTLKAGDKVTFGVTIKNDGITSGTMFFQHCGDVSLWNRDYGPISSAENVTDFVPNGAEKALTYTIPITAGMLNGNSTYTIDIRTDNVPAGGKLSFRYAFVKKGTMATDWTPAPEDTDQAISKVSQTADTIRADLTNTNGDVASVKATANSLQSQITDNKNNISSVKQMADSLTSTVGQMPAKWQQAINDKASAQELDSNVDMDNLTIAGTYLVKDFSVKNAPISAWFMATVDATADHTRVVQRVKKDDSNVAYERSNMNTGWTAWERVATGTDVSSIKQTMDSITTRVANAEGNVSELQQTANGLQSTVVDQSGKISAVEQKADSIGSTVANWGTNLYTNTSDVPQSITFTNWEVFYNFKKEMKGQAVTTKVWIEKPTQDVLVEAYSDKSGGRWHSNTIKAGESDYASLTFTVPIDDWNDTHVSFLAVSGGETTLQYKDLRIMYGEISTLKQTADSLTSKVADTEGNVSSLQQTAQGLQTQITNAKDDVASLQVKADGISADLTNAKHDIASVNVKADGISADLTNAKNDIASVNVKADSLTSSMTNANNQISTLQQRADSITSTLSNGGVNLLNKSNEFGWGIAGWNGNPSHSIIDDDNGLKDYKISLVAGAGNDGFWWGGNNTLNQTYTLSFDAKSDNGAAKLANVGLEGNFLMSNPPTISKEWMRYSVSGKVTEANHNWIIYFAASTADNVYVRRVQLEYGDTATPWKPSNGDISSLQQTAQGLTADMKDAKGNISSLQSTAGGLTTRVTNAEHNVSSLQQTADRLSGVVGDANSGLVSSVNAIPGQISSAITASKQATVIESAVDLHNMTTAGYYLLKGALTNSPVDAWAFLRVITSDSGDRIYHRIWKDNASTVYTEEWTGNWSGWATHINSDNLKSNVITAINQSTEGVSITGNKITLDGNVNVAPGFTLSADYIKAGTMRADRISGGTLNFSNITVNGLTANSISSGSISGQNLNINLDNGVVEFTKGNLHSTDGGFNISIDTKSFYLDMGNDTKLWIDGNGYHLQESATQHLWMNKDGLHNYTDANGNGLWINDTELRILNSKNAGLVAKDGMLQFSANPTWNSPNIYSGSLNSQTYGTIGFNSNLLSSSLNGIFIKGREGVVIGTNSYDGGSLFGADSFLDVGQAGSGINLPDDLNKPASMFTKSALTLLGGPTYPASWGMSDKARISIGCDTYYSHSGASMYSGGNNARGNNISINARNTNIIGYDWVNIKCRNGRVALDGQYVHSYPTYNKTTSAGANVYVADDGALVRSSSARKYKTDIQDTDNDYGNKLIEFTPQKWIDKAEKKRYEEDPENNKKPGYYYGLIADDLDAAGLDMLVNYGAEGEVEGINYDRLAVALLPVIKSLKDQVASLKKQIKALAK